MKNSFTKKKKMAAHYPDYSIMLYGDKTERQCLYILHQCFPIFFWLAPPFLTNKFLSPPYHA